MVDIQAFRGAMAKLAAAVNVITTDGQHGRAGFTATAVCSVTDQPPMLLVCSAPRRDDSCGQSQRFAQAFRAAGGSADVLPLQLDHGQINAELGTAGTYTAAVDRFIEQNLR